VHAALGLGHALLGDEVYGKRDSRVKRTMLHALSISIAREGKPPVAASAPVPADFAALGVNLGSDDVPHN